MKTVLESFLLERASFFEEQGSNIAFREQHVVHCELRCILVHPREMIFAKELQDPQGSQRIPCQTLNCILSHSVYSEKINLTAKRKDSDNL